MHDDAYIGKRFRRTKITRKASEVAENLQLKGSVKEPNKIHNYETEKIIRKASDMAEYIELFGSSTRDRHVQCINVIL